MTTKADFNSSVWSNPWQGAILESDNIVIIGINSNYEIVFWNRGSEGLFGYRSGEVLGKSVSFIIANDTEQKFSEIFQKLESLPEINNVSMAGMSRDGNIVQVVMSAVAVRDNNDKLIGASLLFQKLSGSGDCGSKCMAVDNTWLERAFYKSQDALQIVDNNGRYVFVNKVTIDRFGYSLEELRKHQIWDFQDMEAEEKIASNWRALVETGWSNGETVVRCKDGRVVSGEFQAIANIFPNRHLILFRDLTNRQRIEEELKRVSCKLSFHYENSPMGVIEWDENLRVVAWSKSAEKIFGWRADEILGLSIIDLNGILAEDDERERANKFVEYEKNSTEVQFVSTFRCLTKAGEPITCEWYDSIQRDDSGRLVSDLSLVHDVTDRNRTKRQLEQYKDELEIKNRIMEIMLASSDEDIFNNILEFVLEVMACGPGFMGYIDSDNSLVLSGCAGLAQQGPEVPNEEWRLLPGYWGDDKWGPKLRAGHTILENNPISSPDGTWKFGRIMMAPVMYGGNLEGIVGLSHKDSEYTQDDLERLKFIGSVLSPALHVRIQRKWQKDERQKIAQALKESEHRFRSSLDNLLEGCQIIGHDWKFIYANKASLIPHGPDRDKLASMKITEVYPGIEQTETYAAFRRCMENRTPQWLQTELRYVDGENRLFQISVHPVPEGIFVLYLDVTSRYKAQQALRRSQKRYKEMFDAVLEGIGVVDDNEIVQFCNPAFARILGEKSPEEMAGRSFMDYILPHYCQRAREQIERYRKGEESSYELDIISADEKKKTLLTSVSPRFDEKGRFQGSLYALIDITEEKRLRQLETRAQRLETAGRVAGQVAHDFNNLLGPLMAYPDLIREELGVDHPALPLMNDIETAAKRIADINQQLLTLGRRGHYNLEPFNLNRIINEAVRQLTDVPPSLSIKTEMDDDLMNIKGGYSQIHRVISNLINNARDAMHDNGILIIKTENIYMDQKILKFNSIPQGEYVKMTLTDSGHGISEKDLPFIFDPFYTTKRSDKKRGSGLGLSVVDAVIKDHLGYIDLESTPGIGTTVSIYLPITREEIEISEDNTIPSGTESILVVDDDAIQRQIFQRLLSYLGYRANVVESGEKAVKTLRRKHYDLLVLDMIMPPGIDGAETYKQALEINPEQKAIIISGYCDSDRAAEILELGAGALIRKPLTRQELAKAVRREIDRKTTSVH